MLYIFKYIVKRSILQLQLDVHIVQFAWCSYQHLQLQCIVMPILIHLQMLNTLLQI